MSSAFFGQFLHGSRSLLLGIPAVLAWQVLFLIPLFFSLFLGELIGTATASKNGLVPYYAGGVLSFLYGVKVSLGSIYRPFTCTISTYENAANTFIIAHINITGGSCAKALSRVGTVKIKYSASTKNIYIYNTTGDPIALQRLLNSVGREVTGFSQISSEPTESDLVDIPINAL